MYEEPGELKKIRVKIPSSSLSRNNFPLKKIRGKILSPKIVAAETLNIKCQFEFTFKKCDQFASIWKHIFHAENAYLLQLGAAD